MPMVEQGDNVIEVVDQAATRNCELNFLLILLSSFDLQLTQIFLHLSIDDVRILILNLTSRVSFLDSDP